MSIEIQPLPHSYVVKDLVSDLTNFYYLRTLLHPGSETNSVVARTLGSLTGAKRSIPHIAMHGDDDWPPRL